MNAAALLRTVKAIIAKPEDWCQGYREQDVRDGTAVINTQRCILGALDAAREWAGYRLLPDREWDDLRKEAVEILAQVRPEPSDPDPFNGARPSFCDDSVDESIPEWRAAHINNVSTHDEVMAWINEAIENASISDRDQPTVPSRETLHRVLREGEPGQ